MLPLLLQGRPLEETNRLVGVDGCLVVRRGLASWATTGYEGIESTPGRVPPIHYAHLLYN